MGCGGLFVHETGREGGYVRLKCACSSLVLSIRGFSRRVAKMDE